MFFGCNFNRSALRAQQCGFSFSGIQWGYVNPFNLATQIRLAIPLQSQKPPFFASLSFVLLLFKEQTAFLIRPGDRPGPGQNEIALATLYDHF